MCIYIYVALEYFDTYKNVGEWTQAAAPCLQVCAQDGVEIKEVSECVLTVASQIANGLNGESWEKDGLSGSRDIQMDEIPVSELPTASDPNVADALKCDAFDVFFEVPGSPNAERTEGRAEKIVKIQFHNGIPDNMGGGGSGGANVDRTNVMKRDCPPAFPTKIARRGTYICAKMVETDQGPRQHGSCDMTKDCYPADDDISGWPVIDNDGEDQQVDVELTMANAGDVKTAVGSLLKTIGESVGKNVGKSNSKSVDVDKKTASAEEDDVEEQSTDDEADVGKAKEDDDDDNNDDDDDNDGNSDDA